MKPVSGELPAGINSNQEEERLTETVESLCKAVRASGMGGEGVSPQKVKPPMINKRVTSRPTKTLRKIFIL